MTFKFSSTQYSFFALHVGLLLQRKHLDNVTVVGM